VKLWSVKEYRVRNVCLNGFLVTVPPLGFVSVTKRLPSILTFWILSLRHTEQSTQGRAMCSCTRQITQRLCYFQLYHCTGCSI
jgi:hypothetical protein